MKKYIYCAAALLCVSGVMAQVSKEVEVTRTYIPEVKMATKLHLTPDTSDDSYIEPDIDYSITPISIETKLESELYKPVKVNFGEYKPTYKYYTKLGIGLPLQSDIDIYATPINSKSGYLVGYFNQDGRYAKIKNDYDLKNGSSQSHYRVGAAAGHYFGVRLLEGSLNYNNDKWSRYATTPEADQHLLYQSVDYALRFGDNFTNLDEWNFSVGAAADHFWSRSDIRNDRFGFDARAGRKMLSGALLFGGGYDMSSGSEGYRNNTMNLNLAYRYESSMTWEMQLGLKYYNDKVNYDATAQSVATKLGYVTNVSRCNYVVPDVELLYHLNSSKVVGYFSAGGELLYRDYATLSEENPYLADGLFASKSGVEYDLRFGLKGALSKGRFGYNIYARYGVVKNNLYWALVESVTENYFVANFSNLQSFGANVELQYKPHSNLIFDLDFSASNYKNNKDQLYEDGMSAVEIALSGKYSLKSWRFGVTAAYESSRDCSAIQSNVLYSVEVPAFFDLGLSVDYRLKESFVIFADVTNILNQDMYEWVRYREYGIGAMVGVRFQF